MRFIREARRSLFGNIFVNNCCVCNRSFRLEQHYILVLGKLGGFKYVCNGCADNAEEAAEVYEKKISKSKPAPPPSIPRKVTCCHNCNCHK